MYFGDEKQITSASCARIPLEETGQAGHMTCHFLTYMIMATVFWFLILLNVFCLSEHTGLVGSPCDEDSQCNAGLFCLVHVFEGGKCQELRKDGESCTKGILSRDSPKCAEGLQCMKTG